MGKVAERLHPPPGEDFFFLTFAFQIRLPDQSVTPFIICAPPPVNSLAWKSKYEIWRNILKLAGANQLDHERMHTVMYSSYRFEVCTISATLHVFWPARLRQQVTEACIIRKECFVVRWRRMTMTCGKKRNLLYSSGNGHDDSEIYGQKINFLICSSANSLWL